MLQFSFQAERGRGSSTGTARAASCGGEGRPCPAPAAVARRGVAVEHPSEQPLCLAHASGLALWARGWSSSAPPLRGRSGTTGMGVDGVAVCASRGASTEDGCFFGSGVPAAAPAPAASPRSGGSPGPLYLTHDCPVLMFIVTSDPLSTASPWANSRHHPSFGCASPAAVYRTHPPPSPPAAASFALALAVVARAALALVFFGSVVPAAAPAPAAAASLALALAAARAALALVALTLALASFLASWSAALRSAFVLGSSAAAMLAGAGRPSMISKRTLFESTSVDKKKIDEFVLAWWTACFLELRCSSPAPRAARLCMLGKKSQIVANVNTSPISLLLVNVM